MAKAEIRFELKTGKEEVIKFLEDSQRVGECLAFVGETISSEEGSRWYLKSPMSGITKTEYFKLDFKTGGDKIEWVGEGKYIETRGEITVGGGEEASIIDFTLQMNGLGPMKAIIEPMASVQISKHAKNFSKKLAEKLGCDVGY